MTEFRKILVPYDGSGTSEEAIRYAIDIAGTRSDVEIILMHVIPTISLPFASMNSRPNKSSRNAGSNLNQVYMEMENNAERILAEKKKEMDIGLHRREEQNIEVKIHIAISPGSAASEITKYAKNRSIDLIIIGGRGTVAKKGISKLLKPLGSVSRAVAETAPCPVLIIR